MEMLLRLVEMLHDTGLRTCRILVVEMLHVRLWIFVAGCLLWVCCYRILSQ